MKTGNVPFRDILKKEAEWKRKKQEYKHYVPDQKAIAEHGYDINDPNFRSWECRSYAHTLRFSSGNLAPEQLRKDYAEYQKWRSAAPKNPVTEGWDCACTLTDALLNTLTECIWMPVKQKIACPSSMHPLSSKPFSSSPSVSFGTPFVSSEHSSQHPSERKNEQTNHPKIIRRCLDCDMTAGTPPAIPNSSSIIKDLFSGNLSPQKPLLRFMGKMG